MAGNNTVSDIINDIIKAMAKGLAEFPGIRVYVDEIKQNVNEPCFLVDFVSLNDFQSRTSGMVRLYMTFSAVYLSNEQDDLRKVSHLLPFALKTVSYNSETYNGTNIHIATDNDAHTLTCLVDYNRSVRVTEAHDLMMTLTHTEELKPWRK